MNSWRHVRLRHVCEINPQTPEFASVGDDDELTFLPLEAVWPDGLDTSRRRPKREVESGYTRFREGDVLVPKITPTFEASRSAIARGLLSGVACGTTELHVLRPRPGLDRRFLFYVTHSDRFLQEGTGAMQGVAGQKRVPESVIADYIIDFPSIEEQRRVADFLDRETARIDGVTDRRERLRDLIGERERTLLASVMVRGESGAGRSNRPRPLRTYVDVQLGRQRSPANDTGPHMTRYLRAANVKDGRLDLADVKEMNFEPREQEQFKLEPGDVLVSEGAGSLAAVGAAAMWGGEISGLVCFQNTLLRLRQRMGATLPRFVLWWARYAYTSGLFAAEAGGVNIFHLSADRIRSIPVRFPSLWEQERVVHYLDDQSTRMELLETNLMAQVALLREHRQALITSAVTGQIDVRTPAA